MTFCPSPDQSSRQIQVLPVPSPHSDALDHLSLQARGGTIFHTVAWNQIVSDVFGTEFFYLATLANDRIVGAMPCHLLRNSPLRVECYSPPRRFEVSYGGPIAVGPDHPHICRELLLQAIRLRIGIEVHVFLTPENSEWVQQRMGRTRQFQTAYVDLRPSVDEIWKYSLDGNRRNMIRKAQKKGVEVEVGDETRLDIYYEMVRDTFTGQNVNLKPQDYYACILSHFAPQGQARLYLARQGEHYLSGAIILRYGSMGYYWHGATREGSPNLGQNELIQWEAINWLRDEGCKYYDLLGIEQERLPGIARFKLGFTKGMVPFHYLRCASFPNRLLRRVVNAFHRNHGT